MFATLLRLKSFDLDPFLVSYVLRGIIAQDLSSISSGPPSNKTKQRQLNQEILLFNSKPTKHYFNFQSLSELGTYMPWDNEY